MNRFIVAIILTLAGTANSLYAQDGNPAKLTVDELVGCKKEIAELHRLEINWIKGRVAEECRHGKGASADNCKEANEWLKTSTATSNVSWYVKGNKHCEGSDYPCFGFNEYEEMADQLANDPLPKASSTEVTFWDYVWVAEKCVAKLRVAKRAGKKPASAPTTQAASTVEARSTVADSGSPALPRSGGESPSTDSDRTRKVHNPAADAKSCVQLIQGGDRPGAGTSGHWRFFNKCSSTVEIFWCFVGDDGKCGNGGTWTVNANKGWPTFESKPIKWGACRGRDGGGFDRDSNGGRFTCHLLKW